MLQRRVLALLSIAEPFFGMSLFKQDQSRFRVEAAQLRGNTQAILDTPLTQALVFSFDLQTLNSEIDRLDSGAWSDEYSIFK